MYQSMRNPRYKTLTAQLRAEKRAKALKHFYNEYGKPFLVALVVLPILWALLVLSILVLQPQAEYERLNYPQSSNSNYLTQ